MLLPSPVDMHVHFRQGEMLQFAAKETARYFSHALVMPNTNPPITSPSDIEQYKKEILNATEGMNFTPLLTFKILPDTAPYALKGLQDAGAIAGKVYPKGLTTNAGDGVENFFALYPVFEKMEELGLVLCFHGEMPGEHVEGLDRERAFLRTLCLIAHTFPGLRIVMEHITTSAAVDTILSLPSNVVATITAHHLVLTYDDVGVDRMQPHHYCKPVAKSRLDRDALILAATSGCPKFFFGSDSAPHTKEKKECSECCAGIFTAPVALPVLTDLFEKRNALDRLPLFCSNSARNFYRLPKAKGGTLMVKEPWEVPRIMNGIVPFHAGETLSWQVRARTQ